MKKLILLLSLTILSACGGGRANNNDGVKKDSLGRIMEVSEYCSSSFLSDLNDAEISLIFYKRQGLSMGNELVQAHKVYQVILNKYGQISCKARDEDSKEIKTISNDMVNSWNKNIFDLLYEAHFRKCRNPDLPGYERQGCEAIKSYMRTIGYN